jgi:hypothetical protein
MNPVGPQYDRAGRYALRDALRLRCAAPSALVFRLEPAALGHLGDTVAYSGALAESTGPYYGTSFNPAAVARRIVGSMTLTTRADGTASLSYSVDGVAVQKP